MLNFCDAEARRKVWRRGTQSKDSPITCYGNTRADRVRFVTTLDGHHRPQSPFSLVFSLLVKQKCIIIVHFYKVLKISSSLIFSSSKFKNVFIFSFHNCWLQSCLLLNKQSYASSSEDCCPHPTLTVILHSIYFTAHVNF